MRDYHAQEQERECSYYIRNTTIKNSDDDPLYINKVGSVAKNKERTSTMNYNYEEDCIGT